MGAAFALIVLLADLAAGPNATKAVELPERVTIRASHTGFGTRRETLEITRGPHEFSDGTRVIDERLLHELVAAVTAPMVAKMDVARLRVDPVALRREGEQLAAHLSPAAGAGFLERLCDPRQLPALVASLTNAVASDDYPSVAVELTLRGGERVVVGSGARGPLMLPWKIERGGSASSYAPEISWAIAALLPPKFVNRERLDGEQLPAELARFAFSAWYVDLSATEAEDEYGPELALLRRRFRIESQLLDFRTHADRFWAGELVPLDSSRIKLRVKLRLSDKIAGVDRFLRDADALIRRVKSLPWVNRRLQQHPRAQATIVYGVDSGLSPSEQRSIRDRFETRWNARNARKSAETAPLLEGGIRLLFKDDSVDEIWILLPDGRSLLEWESPMRLRPPGEVPIINGEGEPVP